MSFTMLRIPADSGTPASVIEQPERPTLEQLQAAVGGYIECVDVERVLTDSGRKSVRASVYVNEEGKLMQLPVNYRATDLCSLTLGGFDVIVGDVVVLGLPDDEGESTSVPANVIEIVRDWDWL